jgi:hypothetical protein
MQVRKQITEEDSDEKKPTKYKVLLSYVPSKSSQSAGLRTIKKLTIVSEDDSLFKDFHLNKLSQSKSSRLKQSCELACL